MSYIIQKKSGIVFTEIKVNLATLNICWSSNSTKAFLYYFRISWENGQLLDSKELLWFYGPWHGYTHWTW